MVGAIDRGRRLVDRGDRVGVSRFSRDALLLLRLLRLHSLIHPPFNEYFSAFPGDFPPKLDRLICDLENFFLIWRKNETDRPADFELIRLIHFIINGFE